METNNFIEEFIVEDLKNERFEKVHMRFPPEPNGYLHLGHAFSICLQFETAKKFGGLTNLRFDDTNPLVEETEYVNAIREDVKWLGFDWEDREYYASDYFDKLYAFAKQLIEQGDAYIDDQTPELIAEQKGTPTKPGVNSPFRSRSVEENLDLFERMRKGEFPDGARILRAKMDMTSSNMLMRDPLIYRIKHATHHRTGDAWCIYPMYDFAHGQSDSIENISHSVCTLEFENHRPVYNWFIEKLGIFPSRQIEFARLNFTYTVMGKRKMIQMVREGDVTGWDDPRMPTVSGARRRGYPAAAIREFNERVGVAKRDKLIDLSLLEFFVRQHLNTSSKRMMAVLDPIKLTITNYPEGHTELISTINNPEDESAGARDLTFGGNLFIERDDFKEEANRKYFRLKIGGMVRLKSGYIIEADEAIKDADGNIIEVKARYFPNSRSGEDTSELKPKGTIHWVHEGTAVPATINLYDRLFTDETPDSHEGKDFREFLNTNSMETISAFIEPAAAVLPEGEVVQFLRKGYFAVDKDSTSDRQIFNRTVTLRDNYAKKGK
ncbi:MAG: glutamine--tRNA ligase/YqeY domain fusion protein [Saprospiraceae bacterium]